MLVIGLGNAARGDDAAGLIAARRLGGVEHEGDPLALLDLWDGADCAVVIDAVSSGVEAGTAMRPPSETKSENGIRNFADAASQSQ